MRLPLQRPRPLERLARARNLECPLLLPFLPAGDWPGTANGSAHRLHLVEQLFSAGRLPTGAVIQSPALLAALPDMEPANPALAVDDEPDAEVRGVGAAALAAPLYRLGVVPVIRAVADQVLRPAAAAGPLGGHVVVTQPERLRPARTLRHA